MTNDTRFEFRLPARRRRQLDELAEEAGMATGDLVRLAISRLLADRKLTVKFPTAMAERS
jgi:hypothetical protein